MTSLSDTHKSIRELAEAVALNIILPRQVCHVHTSYQSLSSLIHCCHFTSTDCCNHSFVLANPISYYQANFIQNHFLEMLCFMSGWIGHPIFRPSAVGGASFVYKSSPFCLLQYPHRRQIVYQFFFQQMSERDKHEISRSVT